MKLNSLTNWWKNDKQDKNRDVSHPISSLQSDINRVFDSFFGDFPLTSMRSFFDDHSLSPKVNIIDKEKEIRIEADLPGVDEKDLDVSIHGDHLLIKGEKKFEKEDKSGDYHVMESSYGSFSRVIPLPDGLDTSKIDAVYKKGVLKLIIPKTKEIQNQVKKVTVKS